MNTDPPPCSPLMKNLDRWHIGPATSTSLILMASLASWRRCPPPVGYMILTRGLPRIDTGLTPV